MKARKPKRAGNLVRGLGAAVLGTLAGCSLAPDYKVPDAPEPAAYKEAGDWRQAHPADQLARGTWWTAFGDAQLDALEEQAGRANQDIKAALARFEQARAATRVSRADYFPTLNIGAGLDRARESSNSPKFSPLVPQVTSDYTLEADFSYEVDVWGRVRNAVAAAKAGEQASAADLSTIDLSIRAELASDYFSLRADDAGQVLLDDAVASYTKALELTSNLYKGGAAPLSDLAQAQAQLESARTQGEDVRLRREQEEHAIAVLVGEPASSFHLDPQPLIATPPAIDPGLPSTLLERRPDIAEAERKVVSANAEIGVARAAFYPQFSLSASAGFEGSKIGNWIEAPSRLWSFGPSGMLNVFNAGRYDALTEESRAAYDESVANYRAGVLNAYREVEDNLAALQQLERESSTQAAAVAAAERSLQQANYRYKGGVATYLEVVTAENVSLQARQAEVDIQSRRMSASVLLIKALGGGWRSSDMDAATAGLSGPEPPQQTSASTDR